MWNLKSKAYGGQALSNAEEAFKNESAVEMDREAEGGGA